MITRERVHQHDRREPGFIALEDIHRVGIVPAAPAGGDVHLTAEKRSKMRETSTKNEPKMREKISER